MNLLYKLLQINTFPTKYTNICCCYTTTKQNPCQVYYLRTCVYITLNAMYIFLTVLVVNVVTLRY